MMFRTILVVFNRWNDERNVNVNRNDNRWLRFYRFAGVCNSLCFLTRVLLLG